MAAGNVVQQIGKVSPCVPKYTAIPHMGPLWYAEQGGRMRGS